MPRAGRIKKFELLVVKVKQPATSHLGVLRRTHTVLGVMIVIPAARVMQHCEQSHNIYIRFPRQFDNLETNILDTSPVFTTMDRVQFAVKV